MKLTNSNLSVSLNAIKRKTSYVVFSCRAHLYTVICINTSQFPVWMTFFVGRVMFNQGIIAGGLLIAVSRNAAVGCHPEFWLFFISTFAGMLLRRNHGYILIDFHFSALPILSNYRRIRPAGKGRQIVVTEEIQEICINQEKNGMIDVYRDNRSITRQNNHFSSESFQKQKHVAGRIKIVFWKIVKNDFSRKKVITVAVFLFITMAVILGASATNITGNLIQSISQLKERAVPADITQMHAGEYDQAEIDKFTKEQQEHIAMQETMVLLNFEGMNIHYSKNKTMAGTVQDISFVVQNKKFDFLLDLDNEKLEVKEGEVAVPIYFMVEYDLKIGDMITVEAEGYRKEFVISEYVRDYEMNASLASSKRFVVNQVDYDEMLEKQTGELEYLIEFKLKENGDPQAVTTAYIEAGLPANGPTVGTTTFLMFNAMSDVAIAMVIILISILLIIISALCIKLSFLATIDEDLREIGVMKAMGISKKDIKKVYLTKYRAMSVAAGIIGYLLSFAVVNMFSGNMRLYLSSDLSGNLKYGLSLIAPLFVYVMIVMYCK